MPRTAKTNEFLIDHLLMSQQQPHHWRRRDGPVLERAWIEADGGDVEGKSVEEEASGFRVRGRGRNTKDRGEREKKRKKRVADG